MVSAEGTAFAHNSEKGSMDHTVGAAAVDEAADGLDVLMLVDQGKRQDESCDKVEGGEQRDPAAAVQAENKQGEARRFPFLLFVYGPIADPFFLTYTFKMGKDPELNRSSISGYRMKFHRKYPAPIPARGETISEYSIQIQNGEQLRKITKWYGQQYILADCKISVMRREGQDYAPSTKNWVPPRWVKDRVVGGKVFIWAGDPENEELQEGYWDEGWWARERDLIMAIDKKTNNRVLEPWEVRQRKREDIWKEEDAEKQRLASAEVPNAKVQTSKRNQRTPRGELQGLASNLPNEDR